MDATASAGEAAAVIPGASVPGLARPATITDRREGSDSADDMHPGSTTGARSEVPQLILGQPRRLGKPAGFGLRAM
jgi:hypothetical protein